MAQTSAMKPVVKVWVPIHLALLAGAYALLLRESALDLAILMGLWFFFPVGIMGAIIANATGTGGGVVFVPVFSALQDGAIMIPPELVQIATLKPEESRRRFVHHPVFRHVHRRADMGLCDLRQGQPEVG